MFMFCSLTEAEVCDVQPDESIRTGNLSFVRAKQLTAKSIDLNYINDWKQ